MDSKGRVLGLDVGTKTIGIAMSDPGRHLASPVRTLSRRSVRDDTDALGRLVAEESIAEIVVGMPYELDGSEKRSAKLARQIGEALGQATGRPIHYVDERFTSVDAHHLLIEAGVSRARRKAVIDQQAAVLILQSFLERGPETGDAEDA